MKILAGITLFNPDLVRLKENLRAIAPQVDAVICFDNGSRNSAEVREMIRSEEKAVLILAEGLARVDNRKYKKAQWFPYMIPSFKMCLFMFKYTLPYILIHT